MYVMEDVDNNPTFQITSWILDSIILLFKIFRYLDTREPLWVRWQGSYQDSSCDIKQ